MVEGHSVHRVASLHRQRLLGKKFTALSPNGRFTEGASAINGKTFARIEAHGKNLFCFFGNSVNQKKITEIALTTGANKEKVTKQDSDDDDLVVVHVHFGMAGAWAVYMNGETAPEPTSTNRLRLENDGIVADLSAMTVQHGGIELYRHKLAKLGEDPLRKDACPDALWTRVQNSKKSIGALIMDQSFFTGPGNIYRAEILFKAGVHPNSPGFSLEREDFDRIWEHTVALLQRGYETGSILTVDPEEAMALGKPRLRRYIYNTAKCPRCGVSIKSWAINSRTCYACPRCQPMVKSPLANAQAKAGVKDHVPFNSHCARENAAVRLQETGPERLTVKEIKQELKRLGVTIPPDAKLKKQLVELLRQNLPETKEEPSVESPPATVGSAPDSATFISSKDAAYEKAKAGESLAVEHIAELGPGQARRARSRRTSTPGASADSVPMIVSPEEEDTTLLGPVQTRKAQPQNLFPEIKVESPHKPAAKRQRLAKKAPKRPRRKTTE